MAKWYPDIQPLVLYRHDVIPLHFLGVGRDTKHFLRAIPETLGAAVRESVIVSVNGGFHPWHRIRSPSKPSATLTDKAIGISTVTLVR
jgi:hypothetical protein